MQRACVPWLFGRYVARPTSASLCKASLRCTAHACPGCSAAMFERLFLPVSAQRHKDAVRICFLATRPPCCKIHFCQSLRSVLETRCTCMPCTGRHIGKAHFHQSFRSVVGLHFACVPWLLDRHVAKFTSASLPCVIRRGAHACPAYLVAMFQSVILPVFAERHWDAVRMRTLVTWPPGCKAASASAHACPPILSCDPAAPTRFRRCRPSSFPGA